MSAKKGKVVYSRTRNQKKKSKSDIEVKTSLSRKKRLSGWVKIVGTLILIVVVYNIVSEFAGGKDDFDEWFYRDSTNSEYPEVSQKKTDEYQQSQSSHQFDPIEDTEKYKNKSNDRLIQIQSVMDIDKAEQTAELVEEAFANADVEKILSFMSKDALKRSKTDIENSDPDWLKTFAELFDKRKIEGYGDEFIEFSFNWDGLRYTVDFTVDEDGLFKILRL